MTQTDSIPSTSTPLPAAKPGLIQRLSVRFGGSKPKEMERFLKFVVVGLIGTVMDLGLSNLLMFLFHIQKGDTTGVEIASGIGFGIAVCGNFLLNRYWTYPDSRSRHVGRQIVQFAVVSIIGLGIRTVVLALLSNPFTSVVESITKTSMDPTLQGRVGANMALIASITIVMFWNFFVNRYWTYNDVE